MGLAELSRATGVSRPGAGQALAVLESMGLVSRSPTRPPRFTAEAPDAAVEVLILRRQEELERARLAAAQLAAHYRERARSSNPADLVEIVIRRDVIAQRYGQLQASARSEVLSLDKPPYIMPVGSNTVQFERLDRRVCYRVVYDREAFEYPEKLEEIRKSVRAGEEARTLPSVPLKLIIADRQLALFPLKREDPGAGALIVHPSSLLDAIIALFEALWQRGVPFTPGDTAKIPSPESQRPVDNDLLVLLAAGVKDQAIARQLDISLRTVERRIKQLMVSLGAETRFQAGLQAAQRGWLAAPRQPSKLSAAGGSLPPPGTPPPGPATPRPTRGRADRGRGPAGRSSSRA